MNQPINSPCGFVSGAGVITRADGTRVPFEFKSEETVSLETFAEICGKNPQAAIIDPTPGE